MNFFRNSLAVLLGLLTSALIISFGITMNHHWNLNSSLSVFEKWERVLRNAYLKHDDFHFILLLLFSGIAATIGGIITAIVVKHAKVAYAILIGFILLLIAILDLIMVPFHPTFYKIGIFFVFFPFSWIGGKITEIIYKKKHNHK